jgi:hypothetical protein
LGALFGRKAISMSTLGTGHHRGTRRGPRDEGSEDVTRAQTKQHEAEDELKALEAEIAEEIAALGAGDGSSITIETVEIKPKRGAVDVRLVALSWQPD